MSRKDPRRILIVNAHSQTNVGDYAIVLGQLRLLEKIAPAARLTITSRTPSLDRSFLAGQGVRVIAPIFNTPSGSAGKWLPWAKTLLSLVLPLPALVFLRRLSQADLVMACGGGYFYSSRRIPGFTFWQNYLHIRLAVMLKKQIIFFPQSYGPLANPLSRRLLARLIASDRVRAVFAREEISLSVIRGILADNGGESKVRFCPDMAFYGSPEPEPFHLGPDLSGLPRPRVALALRDWDFPEQKGKYAKQQKKQAYLDGILAACRDLHREHNASFFIFNQSQGPSSAEDDRRISGIVHDRLREIIPHSHLIFVQTPVGASPLTFIQLLRQADMLITSRMHAAILAFMAAVPAVVIGYQHKSLGILQALGLGSLSLPIEEVGKETLLTRCEDVWQNREEWKKVIAAAVCGTRETIEVQFQEIFKIADEIK